MKKFLLIYTLISSFLLASDHGIYLQTLKGHPGELNVVTSQIVNLLKSNGYEILAERDIASPDIVREDSTELCGFKSRLIVAKSDDYLDFITSFGNKYLIAGFLKVAIYETPNGLDVNIADPETINRIVFNDLYENDEIEKYNQVIEKTMSFRTKLISLIHSIEGGEKVEVAMEPIRDDEDLAESSKDMFMMVGSLTFFNDEDQFPMIHEVEAGVGIENLKKEFTDNVAKFKPLEDDIEYRWNSADNVLQWEIISEIYSPDSMAVVLGLSRPRTEGLSFHIAGRSREEDDNLCPGIDHSAAYPIEVLLIEEEDYIRVYTAREMFRMDMYFWDAGMPAFMDHMSMPGILDESIKKALLGEKYSEN